MILLADLRVMLLASAVLLVLVYQATKRHVPKGLREVPGPRGWPIFGNTFQLTSQPQGQFQAWALQYGEVFRIKIGWETWIFVNSPGAVKEIFDKKSAVTSGRPPAPVASDVISNGMRILFMSYTPTWRKLRTIIHGLLTPKMADTFKPIQEFEAKQLLYDIYSDNADLERFYSHVRRYTTSVMMTSTYGKRVKHWESEETTEIYGVLKEFSEGAAPGAYLADMIPPLARIPKRLQWWRDSALQYQYRQTRIWMKFWNNLKEQMAAKKAPECFVKHLIETQYEKEGIDEIQAAYVAGTMIEAGSETTSSTLNSAIMYLARYPEVQSSANEELSRVVGDSRSPTFDDEADLPYIRATVKEALRIRPVANIGSPHYTTSDVIYKDFFIPKGTVVTINQYAIHYDPDRYEDAAAFKPERYLQHSLRAGAYAGHADPYARDHFSFGGGRRICPGMHLAENSLFILLARILWAFEIRPPLGADGKEEVVDVSDNAYEDGVNTLPKPFKVRYIPRSPERAQVLLADWEKAKVDGYFLGNVKIDADGVVV